MSETRLGARGVRAALAATVLAASLMGCPNAGEDLVQSITGTALVGGRVFLDGDGDRLPASGADAPLSGVRVRLLVTGTRDTVARVNSAANGTFVFDAVPVGRYSVVVPGEASFGDSLAVVRVDPSDVNLAPNDTVVVDIAVSFPLLSVAEARQATLGTKVFLQGVALNTPSTFGDTTVHLADTSGAIRVTDARGTLVAAGDSVRVLGRVSARDGQPTLDGGVFTLVAIVGGVSPILLKTGEADSAGGGVYDAQLVRVVDATITDTATVAAGDYVATVVDDEGGPLEVVVDTDAFPGPQLDEQRNRLYPGAVADITGVLVPGDAATGRWRLKPRVAGDVQ
jgi:hypothetical protein